MLQYLRENRIQNYFFVLIYILLLRLHTFFYDYGAAYGESIVYDMLGLSFAENQAWYKMLGILLLLYHVIMINRLASINHLSYSNSLFPGVFYVLILSMIPEIHPLSTVLVGNTFIILAVFEMFQAVHRNQRAKRLFNSGFFVSIAVFIDLNFIYMVPFFIISANAIILVRMRDIILYLLGFLTPVYFLLAYWILIGHFNSGVKHIAAHLQLFQYDFIYQNYGVIKVGIIGALVLFLLVVFNSVVTRTNIFVRNKLTFLFYLMVFSVVIFGLTFHTRLEDLQLIIFPLGVLIALYLVSLKKTSVAESFHLILLLLVILFQYFLK